MVVAQVELVPDSDSAAVAHHRSARVLLVDVTLDVEESVAAEMTVRTAVARLLQQTPVTPTGPTANRAASRCTSQHTAVTPNGNRRDC